MKPGSNMQLSKKSLAEELAGRLQGQFMSGKFEVGEKLPPEPELMQIFGVGRSTVREAVRILSNMGFLKVRQGAGTFVERLTPPDEPMERRLGRADLHDLDEVRKILEVAIAEKAAERRTAHDAAVLEKHLAERERPQLPGHCRPVSKPTSTSTSPWPRPRTTKSCASCTARRPPI